MNFTEVASLSFEQLNSKTVKELKVIAKNIELKGYSRLPKGKLVDFIYSATDIERQSNINQKSSLSNKYDNPITVENLNQLLKSEDTPVDIAKKLFMSCLAQGYKISSIASNLNRQLNSLKEDPKLNLSKDEFEELKEEWNSYLTDYNRLKIDREDDQKDDDATTARGVRDTKKIVEWAIDNLKSPEYTIRGIALALLSGRRMVEIYGTSTYEIDGNFIKITGIAKKKDKEETGLFIPLCDPELWFDVWNELPKKNLTNKQVNGTISKITSRKFPMTLKDLGVEKFKDCRDAYASICIQSFREIVVRKPERMTKKVMCHSSTETTAYYDTFEMTGLPELHDVFKEYSKLRNLKKKPEPQTSNSK